MNRQPTMGDRVRLKVPTLAGHYWVGEVTHLTERVLHIKCDSDGKLAVCSPDEVEVLLQTADIVPNRTAS